MNVSISLKCSVLYYLLQILPQQVKQFLQKEGQVPLVEQLALISELLLAFKVEMNEAIPPLIKLFLFHLLVVLNRWPCIYLHSEVFFLIGLETYNTHLKTSLFL